MKVSIITVVYNNANTVAEAIESVLGQNYNDIEYIVIDGGSDDGTVNIINHYKSHLSTFISEPDQGVYDGMNKGLSYATGDIIGFLNGDDLLASKNCVSAIVSKFKETQADVVYGNNLYVDPEDTDKVIRYWESGKYKREKFKNGWMPPHLATYIKKSLYDEYGGFDTDIEIAGDYELMFRFMYKHHAKSVYLPKVISKMRVGGMSNSTWSVVLQSSREVYYSWKKHDLEVSPLIMVKKPFQKLKQYFTKGNGIVE